MRKERKGVVMILTDELLKLIREEILAKYKNIDDSIKYIWGFFNDQTQKTS